MPLSRRYQPRFIDKSESPTLAEDRLQCRELQKNLRRENYFRSRETEPESIETPPEYHTPEDSTTLLLGWEKSFHFFERFITSQLRSEVN